MLKLYLLSQSDNRGYDTYDSCVVAAKSAKDARTIHPQSYASNPWDDQWSCGWAKKPENVTATCIGTAKRGTKRGLILASFNAG